MPLKFPVYEHFPLRNPPLAEVVCQVRFPPILKIAGELPASFQDSIRDQFPQVQRDQAVRIESGPVGEIRSAGHSPPVHRFLDRTGTRITSLALDFYALSTTKYDSWEHFSNDLRFVTEAAISDLRISYATRIGLRYVNRFTVKNTNSKSFYTDVLDMLRTEITAVLRTDAILEPIQGFTEIRVEHSEGKLTFRSGIVQDENSNELGFLLDFDCFTDMETDISTTGLLELCDRYHALIYNAFRWSIKPEKLALFDQ